MCCLALWRGNHLSDATAVYCTKTKCNVNGITSKHLKGHFSPRVGDVTFLDQRVIPGSLWVK